MSYEAQDLVMCCGPGERNLFRGKEHMLSSLEASTLVSFKTEKNILNLLQEKEVKNCPPLEFM